MRQRGEKKRGKRARAGEKKILETKKERDLERERERERDKVRKKE